MNIQLGRSLWGVMLAYAQCYPVAPSLGEQALARHFFSGFGKMLQAAAPTTSANSDSASPSGCDCFQKWQLICTRVPPAVQSRDHLIAWVTAAHDWVNQNLGKPIYDQRSLEHAIFARLKVRRSEIEGDVSSHSSGCQPCAAAKR